MSDISKENLLKALSGNYKGVKPNVDQIMQSNENAYSIISEVLAQIIKSNKVDLICKLQGLRFFKDVF